MMFGFWKSLISPFPKVWLWQNWLCNRLLYDPGNEHWNFSFKDWVLWKQSGETLVANPRRKFKVGFSVCFESWEGSPNYLDLVFTEFTMEISTPISVFLACSVGYSAGCSDVRIFIVQNVLVGFWIFTPMLILGVGYAVFGTYRRQW